MSEEGLGADATRTDAGRAPAASAKRLAPGSQINRFVVNETLGAGAMGVVVDATDPDLDRRVAIKLLRPDSFGEGLRAQAAARMLREAQAMAKVSHPNIVTVFEVGTYRGEVFIAMERVVGSTMRHWLAVSPRTVSEILSKFVAAGRGLAAAHVEGLVHRDFKPDNVLVGNDGRVHVTDFGLVSSTATATLESDDPSRRPLSSLDDSLTLTGVALGTPRYMSPEQHAAEQVTAASDQFSFAVALWEALYRGHPFEATTVRELRGNVLAGAMVDSQGDAGVPPLVREALIRALHVSPLARHDSMSELLSALEPFAARPRRKPRIVVGLVAVALASAVSFGVWSYQRGERLRDQADRERAQTDSVRKQLASEKERRELVEKRLAGLEERKSELELQVTRARPADRVAIEAELAETRLELERLRSVAASFKGDEFSPDPRTIVIDCDPTDPLCGLPE
jgi:serine/threonine protein kinase